MRSSDVKSAILFLTQTLRLLSENPNADYKTFYGFCEDKNLIFSSTVNKRYYDHIDAVLTTNGLLAQLLEEFGVTNYQNFSDQLRNTLLSIQSNLEVKADITLETINLKSTLETLELIVK